MKSKILLSLLPVLFCTSFHYKNSFSTDYYIVIDKSDYELHLFDQKGWLSSYPVVFGNNDQGDKLMQGDRKTPEGTFTIIQKKHHSYWYRFMLLDYPNEDSYARFKDRKARGLIPAGAQIGGGIGIHGTLHKQDYMVDKYYNWTLGCISLKRADIEELYNLIPDSTTVTIRK
jgi:murein L,D-transpeptidase YafK